MKQLTKYAGLIATAIGSIFMGVSVLPHAVAGETIAQLPTSQNTMNLRTVLPLTQIRVAHEALYPQNPCPSIWYENPYRLRVVVPYGCPANAITQRLATLGLLNQVRNGSAQAETPDAIAVPYRY